MKSLSAAFLLFGLFPWLIHAMNKPIEFESYLMTSLGSIENHHAKPQDIHFELKAIQNILDNPTEEYSVMKSLMEASKECGMYGFNTAYYHGPITIGSIRCQQIEYLLKNEHWKKEIEEEAIKAQVSFNEISSTSSFTFTSVPTYSTSFLDPLEKLEPNSLSYEMLFHQYIEVNQPVIISDESSKDILSIVQALETSSSCMNKETKQFENLSLQECKDITKDLSIPSIIVNDYLQRMDISLYPPKVVSFSSQFLKTCPNDAHMVLIPLRKKIEIHLLKKKFLPLFFSSSLKDEKKKEILLKDLNEENMYNNLSFDIEKNPILSLLSQHQIQQAHVHINEALFIPGDTFLFLPSSTSLNEQNENQLLMYCYVDASNYNNHLKKLEWSGLISWKYQQALHSFQSTSFDSFMHRLISKEMLLYSEYMNYPKIKTYISSKKLTRREKFKRWQEDNRWKRHMEIKTLPILLPPRVFNITRSWVMLSWQDVYQTRKDDTIEFGFLIEIYEGKDLHWIKKENISYSDCTRSSLPTEAFGEHFDGHELSMKISSLNSNTIYSFRIAIFLGDEIGPWSLFSSFIHTQSISTPSIIPGLPFHLIEKTTATSITLNFQTPIDDGGSKITNYIIAIQYIYPISSIVQRMEDEVDQMITLKVHEKPIIKNLLPSMKYIFRIAAMNEKGIGPWSLPTSILQTKDLHSTEEVMLKPGIGHVDYYIHGINIELDAWGKSSIPQQLQKDQSILGPIVSLSDRYQQLILYPNRNHHSMIFIDAWASHYSAKIFNVSSEIIFADPIDGSTPLKNPQQIRDRLVYMKRGKVPLIQKVLNAQNAGALGVVIGDEEGRCLSFNQNCVPGGDKNNGEGFGASDDLFLWKKIYIPSILILQLDAKILKQSISSIQSSFSESKKVLK